MRKILLLGIFGAAIAFVAFQGFAVFAIVAGPSLTDWFTPPKPYTAPSLNGIVVDADDKHPLGGVAIVARWEARVQNLDGHLMGRGTGPTIERFEITTAADGTFVIPGWGPKDVKASAQVEPSFSFVAPGYETRSFHSYGAQGEIALQRGTSEPPLPWD